MYEIIITLVLCSLYCKTVQQDTTSDRQGGIAS